MEARMNLQKSYDRFYKIITIFASLVCIFFFGMAAIEENFLREWKSYQKEFKTLLVAKAENDRQMQAADDFSVEIRQVILEGLGRVDRCVSCHNGLENPRMAGADLPHAAHSGDYLRNHPVEDFGCTICHGGQDRALGIKHAFARAEGVHWEYPVLPLRYVQASCGRCHVSVFNRDQKLAGAEKLMQGREIFFREGCLGCHKVRGTGGSVGLELTDQGSKTKFEYSFAHVAGDFTVQNWLYQHFLDPQKVSVVSEMPPIRLERTEMEALITFTMSLFNPDLPASYASLDLISEFKGGRDRYDGKTAYETLCAVCHGAEGEGKDYRVFEASVPRLSSPEFLAVASKEMLRFTIQKGRSGRTMSSWTEQKGGLTKDEIESLAGHILGWKAVAPSYAEVKRARADTHLGGQLYRSRCGTCHGGGGEGGIGPALNNQDLLSIADDRFLYETMVNGRANTAMPSWSRLTRNEIASLIAFIRAWQRVPSLQLSDVPIAGDVQNGERIFNGMCAGCHGKYGQGSVGPAIWNRDFLAAASDQFILQSISRGRSQSAMRSWAREFQGLSNLTRNEMNDVVAFIRSRETWRSPVIYSNITPGTPANGKVLYESMCAGCHGINGEGKHGPALNNQELLNAATDGFLQATIALGRSGTAMRSWAKGAQGYEELSGDQINDIVTYIRSWQRQTIALDK